MHSNSNKHVQLLWELIVIANSRLPLWFISKSKNQIGEIVMVLRAENNNYWGWRVNAAPTPVWTSCAAVVAVVHTIKSLNRECLTRFFNNSSRIYITRWNLNFKSWEPSRNNAIYFFYFFFFLTTRVGGLLMGCTHAGSSVSLVDDCSVCL